MCIVIVGNSISMNLNTCRMYISFTLEHLHLESEGEGEGGAFTYEIDNVGGKKETSPTRTITSKSYKLQSPSRPRFGRG